MRQPSASLPLIVVAVAIVLVGNFPAAQSLAVSAEELQTKIQNRQQSLKELEKEIERYKAALRSLAGTRRTLANTLRSLRLTERKLAAEIQLTQRTLETVRREIAQLSAQIASTTQSIQLLRTTIAQQLRHIEQLDDVSAVEAILSRGSLSALWEENETLRSVQHALSLHTKTLNQQKRQLLQARSQREAKARRLEALLRQQRAQRESLAQAKRDREQLLQKTKAQEAAYQALLAKKRRARAAIEAELNQLAAQLSYLLDPTKLPGRGALSFPFSLSYQQRSCREWERELGNPFCITQYFGNTPFARSGAYRGRGHNGIDFRAPLGTKVYSAGVGIVRAIGNTDRIPGCFSYGKWVLIDHPTGIATLYAHLSSIAVRPGQRVTPSTLIGLSGATGYATGPHLHFSVLARDGVEVRNLAAFYRSIGRKPITPCSRGGAVIPVAAFSAYLNPLDFLPR